MRQLKDIDGIGIYFDEATANQWPDPADAEESLKRTGHREAVQQEDLMPTIEAFIDVNVPVETAYGRWRQFEKFLRFMEGMKQGKHNNTYRLHW